jgi:hypothetical protein
MLQKQKSLQNELEFETPLNESVAFTLPGYRVQAVCVLAKHSMIALLVSAKPDALVAYPNGVHLYSLTSGELQRVIKVTRAVHMCVTHPEADSVLLTIENKYCVIELFLFEEHSCDAAAATEGAGAGSRVRAAAGTSAQATVKDAETEEEAALSRKLPTRVIGKNVVYNPRLVAANRTMIAVAERWPCDGDRITYITYRYMRRRVPDTTITEHGHSFCAHHGKHYYYESLDGLPTVPHTHVALISYADGTLIRRTDFSGLDAITLLPASDPGMGYEGPPRITLHEHEQYIVTVSKQDPNGHAVRTQNEPVDSRLRHGKGDASSVAVDVVIRPAAYWNRLTGDPRSRVKPSNIHHEKLQDYTYYITYTPGYIAKVARVKGWGENEIKAIYGTYDGPTWRDAKGRLMATDRYKCPIPVFTNVTFNRPENICMAPDKGLVVHDFDRAGEARVRVLTRPSTLRMDFLSMLVARQRRDS